MIETTKAEIKHLFPAYLNCQLLYENVALQLQSYPVFALRAAGLPVGAMVTIHETIGLVLVAGD